MRILVTGNGSGIGNAIETCLVEAGHRVIGTHNGRRIHDISTDTGRYLLIGEFVDRNWGIDVLINNAGVLDVESFGQLTVAGIEKVFRINVVAPLLLAQEAVGLGAKLIVNIGSFYGVSGSYGQKPTYAASKAALHNATLSLSRHLGPSGVRVVTVAPGIVPTGIHANQGGIQKHGNGHSNLGRVGTPEEVARAVRHVIENEYINGTVIEVHGGR